MTGPHPSISELLQFANGELDDARFEQVAAHLEHCDQCADVLRQTGAFPRFADGRLSLRESSDLSPPEPAVTAHQPMTEGPGSTIGPYKLLQKLGEGGMGVVYMAEQEETGSA